MEEKYIKYNLEEFIEDRQFIAWVLKGSNNNKWKKFIEDNPEINTKAKKAREIILLLRDTYEVLDEESDRVTERVTEHLHSNFSQ